MLRTDAVEARAQISLDTSGSASKLLVLNNPVVETFIDLADLRYDIVFTTSLSPARTDIYQFNPNPRLRPESGITLRFNNFKTRYSQTQRRHDEWVVSLDEVNLIKYLKTHHPEAKLNHTQLAKTLRSEMTKATFGCLIGEKIYNGYQLNIVTFNAYLDTLSSMFIFTSAFGMALTGDIENVKFWLAFARIAKSSTQTNLVNFGYSLLMQRISMGVSLDRSFPTLKDPFIRRSFLGMLLPPIPLDHLIIGGAYLALNRNRWLNLKQIEDPTQT